MRRVTASAPATAPARAAAVDQRLARATAALCRDHPAHAAVVRGVLAPLRDRVRRVHQECSAAEAPAWAAYTADLDRGLDELAVEMARAAAADVPHVLTTAATALERRAEDLRESIGRS